jgi:hypothetical protein
MARVVPIIDLGGRRSTFKEGIKLDYAIARASKIE